MNWNDRAAWLYRDSQPDYGRLAKYNIRAIYIDPRSDNAAAVIKDARGRGYVAGIYEVASWYGLAPLAFVQQVNSHTNALIPRPWPDEAPPLMLDLENVSKDWCAQTVATYRKYQPARPTAYTNEPFKDGTVVPVQALIDANMHWYPQTYFGDMTPVDTAAVVLEVARWGFPADRIHPFYDGARLPNEWRDGCVFTMDRLP